MAWFKKTRKPMTAPVKEKPSRVPEGLWVKCPGCSQVIYNKDLATNLNVCPKCAHHFRLNAVERLRMLFDASWTEYDKDLVSTDPLDFTDTKPYKSRLKAGIESTGLKDAVIVASGAIDGIETVVASMEYGFIGGSMGVVVGEKITRGIERALAARTPVVIVCCSGGARMMEGALSLMQMAKICGELRDARRPEHRGTKGAHRIRRAARDRADDPPDAARRVSAQRVPAREGHAGPGHRPPRDEGGDCERTAIHGRVGQGRGRVARLHDRTIRRHPLAISH
jgi:hypothetical protein